MVAAAASTRCIKNDWAQLLSGLKLLLPKLEAVSLVNREGIIRYARNRILISSPYIC